MRVNHYRNAVVIGRRFISGADPQNKRIAIATLLAELRAMLSGSYTKGSYGQNQNN